MSNILIKKFKEKNIEINTGFSGKWKVEIVHPNGEIEKPFGDEMRPNLIVNNGLNFLFNNSSWENFQANYGYLLPFLAMCGSGTKPAEVTDTDLQSVISTTSTIHSATQDDDLVLGSRTFTKIFNFPVVTGNTNINEIGLKCYHAASNYGFQPVDNGLFSRFITPSPITLTAGQYLRLTYSLSIIVPATVNPIPIGLVSGPFDGSGQLKLLGQYRDLMGTINSNGTPGELSYNGIYAPLFMFGYSPNRTQYTIPNNAHLVGPGVGFSDPNTDFPARTKVGTTISSTSVVGGTILIDAYANNSFKRDAAYIFAAGNPSTTSNIGGIFFRMAIDFYPSAQPPCGWYYKFNTTQVKESNFALVINVTNSVSRT